MKFDKNKFIKTNNQFLYNKLCDFLECEKNSYKEIIHILLCENMKSFMYEGNQYLLTKNEKSSQILIADEIARENGVSDSQCAFIIKKNELLELIINKKDR